MAGSDLYVDPDGVRSAAGALQGAPAGPPAMSLQPPAADLVSVSTVGELCGHIETLRAGVEQTNARALVAAGGLAVTSATYESTEANSAGGLVVGCGAVAAGPSMPGLPMVPTSTIADLPPGGGGMLPANGRQASELLHGGPGTGSLQAASAALSSLAGDLDDSAARTHQANSIAHDSWTSPSANVADDHLSSIESSYTAYGTHARAIATNINYFVDRFERTKATIPPPETFTDIEGRVQNAEALNRQSGGMYTPAVVHWQTQLANAHHQALTRYQQYAQGAGLNVPEPPAGVQPAPGDPASDGGGGDPHPTHPGHTDPAADPLTDPAAQDGEELLGTIVPAVLGGVAGAAGAALGAVTGVAEKLQQAGGQLLGGLGQGAGALTSAMSAPKLGSRGDGKQPPSLGDPGGPVDGGGDGGGGGQPGDTQPASAPDGPLAPPTTAAAAVPADQPSAAAAPAAALPAGGGAGVGAMGAPLMPMMAGPRRGEGGGPDDERLYPKRRLRVETPPNAEPVRGRREQRRTSADKKEQTP